MGGRHTDRMIRTDDRALRHRPRRMTGPKRQRPRRRVRLSSGGRYPKNLPEFVEVLVARAIGRDLGAGEGCLVQLVALVAFLAVLYWFVASGLLVAITTTLAKWYAQQVHFGPTPTPVPSPT